MKTPEDFFNIPEELNYLNTPASGLMPDVVRKWRVERDQSLHEPASHDREQQPFYVDRLKQDIALFFGGDARRTFLVPGFSVGFNAVLGGLGREHVFLLLDNDYPAINFPVKSRGYKYHTVPFSSDLEERILAAIIEHKPTVFAFSLVHYISGIKISQEFVKELKRRFPELLLLADGTQYCGTEPFDFASSGLDFLGSSGYKWLMAGFGNGFCMLSEQLNDLLYTEAKRHGLPTEPFMAHKTLLSTYFEPGHQDSLCYGTLHRSIQFIQELGWTCFMERLDPLSQKAKQAFMDRKLLADHIAHRHESHSTLFNLALIEGADKFLESKNIRCCLRGGGVRVGFHIYNTEKDLEHLLAVLDNNGLY